MRITVIGTGYVGLVTGVCFSEMGNEVWCVDIDENKIEILKMGISPIYEPGLEVMLQENTKGGRLHFTTDISVAITNSNLCFIAVGTPMGEDGSADLQYVVQAAKQIGQTMQNTMIVVDKSTVPVGTADMVKETIQKELENRNVQFNFDIVSNPEFLKEGTAISDCMYPSRVVIGSDSEEALMVMRELYMPFIRNTETFMLMDVKSAEMTKYTANAMLATKISFMNEISNICERVGANINHVRKGIGSDPRIGYHFIYPGCGYGGSCFPKDVQALIKMSSEYGYAPKILSSVEEVNQEQKHILSQKVFANFGEDLTGKIFAIWGLAFKPDTDDMREASAITIIHDLISRGAVIHAYDPKAISAAKQFYFKGNQNIVYFDSKYDAVLNANALLLVTEWKEFRSPDFTEMKKRMRGNHIFDGRNLYNIEKMHQYGFEYEQIGVKR